MILSAGRRASGEIQRQLALIDLGGPRVGIGASQRKNLGSRFGETVGAAIVGKNTVT